MFFVLSSISEIEARLPRSQLMVLCRNEAALKWMSTCDHLMYQALVEILIPDVLRPIPSELKMGKNELNQKALTHFFIGCKQNSQRAMGANKHETQTLFKVVTNSNVFIVLVCMHNVIKSIHCSKRKKCEAKKTKRVSVIMDDASNVCDSRLIGPVWFCLNQRVLKLLPHPSGALTQAIRNFAKSLEGWLTNAMNAIPQRMIQTKVKYCCFIM